MENSKVTVYYYTDIHVTQMYCGILFYKNYDPPLKNLEKICDPPPDKRRKNYDPPPQNSGPPPPAK